MATSNPSPNSSASDYENHHVLNEEEEEEEGEDVGRRRRDAWPRRGGAVMLEGYVQGSEGDEGGSDGGGSSSSGIVRTRSLMDEDLEELKGCVDLGFGFSYDEIPELCGTLPALELCYSMSQRFSDDQQQRTPTGHGEVAASAASVPVPNWRIAGAGVPAPSGVRERRREAGRHVGAAARGRGGEDVLPLLRARRALSQGGRARSGRRGPWISMARPLRRGPRARAGAGRC